MAIDNKTLKIVIEGDSSSGQQAFQKIASAAAASETSIKKVVTTYDTLGKAYDHFIELTSSRQNRLVNAQKNIEAAFSQSELSGKIRTSLTEQNTQISAMLAAQQRILDTATAKRVAAKQDEVNTINKLQAKLASERISLERKAEADLLNEMLSAQTRRLQVLSVERAKEARVEKERATAILSIEQKLASARADLIAKMSAARAEQNRKALLQEAKDEKIALENRIKETRAFYTQAFSSSKYAPVAQPFVGPIQQKQIIEKAPTIDWSERKALLEKELAYEAAKSASFFNAERAKAAQYARDKLEIEQAYASKRRTIEEQVRSGALSISNADKQHTAALTEYGNAIRKLPDLKEHIAQHRSLVSVIAQSTAVYRIFSSMWNTLWNGVFSIPKVGIQLESTIASLSSTAGNMAMVSSLMEGLNGEARRTGISINALRENFKNFQASTSLAGASLKDTWEMFTNMNTVSLALHHTTAQTQGIFNALAQIFNKSKVQSEELVKQLGNLLPGAFAAFAKSMHKSTQELSELMKRGVVTAQDTMLDFTRSYSKDFLEAAAIASVGFNAELGRMNNSFTSLGEAIYGQTRGPMVTFMQTIAKVTNYIADGIKGNNEFTSVLKQSADIIKSVVIGALAALAGKYFLLGVEAVKTGTAVTSLTKILGWFSAPTAIIAGIALITSHLLGLKNAARDSINDLKETLGTLEAAKAEAARATQLNLSGEKLKSVVDIEEGIKTVKATVKTEQAKLDELEQKAKLLANAPLRRRFTLEQSLGTKEDISRKIEEQKKLISDGQAAISNAVEERKKILDQAARNKELQELDKQNNIRLERMKKAEDLAIDVALAKGDQAGAARLRAHKKYDSLIQEERNKISALEAKQKKETLSEEEKTSLKEALQDLTSYQFLLAQESTASQKAAAGKKEYSAAIKNNSDEVRTNSLVLQQQIKSLDAAYAQNTISLQQYSDSKRQVLQQEYEKEVSLLAKRRDIALANKNVGEAQHITNQIEQAAIQNKTKLAEVENEQVTKTNELLDATERLNAEYVKAKTGVDTTAEQKYDKLLKNINSLPEEKRLVVKGQVEELNAINTALNRTRGLNEQINQINSTASEKIQTINALKNVGAMSEIRSAIEINNILEEQIALIEEKISIKEKELALAPSSLELDKEVESLKKQKAALEQLKQTAETTGNVLTQKIGGAFESSFASLLSGTSSGKQAFSDFVNSVIQDINRMVASELRSSILQPLLQKGIGALIGAIGGSFGGGGYAAATSGTTSAISSYLGTALQANGGVNTGMGIGNGIVLDKATYFPTASPVMMAMGGVIAGEAGKEAVLPLAETSNGKLGVQTTGGTSGSGITIENMAVVVQERKDESSDEQAGRIAQAMREQLLTLIDGRITNSVRSGGLLNQTRVQTAFSN